MYLALGGVTDRIRRHLYMVALMDVYPGDTVDNVLIISHCTDMKLETILSIL